MGFPERDTATIRELAKLVLEIASLTVQQEKREMWSKLNALKDVRPMVWINEIPWWEFKDEEELKCSCEDEFCRDIEARLRTKLYLWDHARTDMVVDPVIYSDYVFSNSEYGLEVETVGGRYENGFGAQEYVPTIRTEADIEKIKTPKITVDWKATDRNYQMMCDLVGDVLPVEKRGVVTMWMAPWDMLIQWMGVTEFFIAMVDQPEFVHKAISRLVDAYLAHIDQLEELGLFSAGNGNYRVGSGGLGITDELPQPDYDGKHTRSIDLWGMSTGQIFSEVSPEMHDEFCVQHEMRLLERFGLIAYGCCEPLHHKMHILRKIPRLRRVSMSTWIDVDKAVENVGSDYIFSYKPNPAVLAWDTWEPEQARSELRNVLNKTKGCIVELIMKDISTCRHEPRRIWEWCDLAMEVAEEYA